MTKIVNFLLVSFLFVNTACATPYTCDPSALTFDSERCKSKPDAFSFFSEHSSDPQLITENNEKKKDLTKTLDVKLQKLDFKRKARKQEKNPVTFSTNKLKGKPEASNRGMATQIQKSKEIQGEIDSQKSISPVKKNAYVGVDLPIKSK